VIVIFLSKLDADGAPLSVAGVLDEVPAGAAGAAGVLVAGAGVPPHADKIIEDASSNETVELTLFILFNLISPLLVRLVNPAIHASRYL
jgi:hypothetical protein